MRKIITLFLTLCFCAAITPISASEITKNNLRILYVGGSADWDKSYFGDNETAYQQSVKERMVSFEQLLSNYFSSVTVVNAQNYTQQMSYDYDVTIMDGVPTPRAPRYTNREKGIYYAAAYFTEDFDKPVITIGELGETLGRRIGIKNDWYCLCLDADAHSWRQEHPIFNTPFKVKMTVVNKPTPENAYHYEYFYDGDMPDELPMWSVQTKGYSTDRGFRVGMVARPWRYEDSPEVEYISSGVCDKTLDAVAIGRHGNFFHWGFAASPKYMTEEAQTVFANAVVYIASFDGKGVIARKYNDRIATREYLKERKRYATPEAHQERVESDNKWNEEMIKAKIAAEEKQAAGDTLTSRERQMLNFTPQTPMSFEEFLKRYQRDVFDQIGMDWQAYSKYYDDNYDYFYSTGIGTYVLLLDEDAKSLGIANNDKRLLDTAIKLLESGKDSDKARRILTRYTLEDFDTPELWRAWYNKYQDRLFFTETGGWLFLVNTNEPGVNNYIQRETRECFSAIKPDPTDDKNPVSVAASLEMSQQGENILYIVVNVHTGYHIYEKVSDRDPYIPFTLKLELPDGYENIDGGVPIGKYYNQNGTTIYEDSVMIRIPLRGSNKGAVKCTISYQCCDSQICFPPEERELYFEIK